MEASCAQSEGGVVDAWCAAREATMTAASLRSGAPFFILGDVWCLDVRLEGLWFNKFFIVNYTSYFTLLCFSRYSGFPHGDWPDISTGSHVMEVSDQVVEGDSIVLLLCQDECQVFFNALEGRCNPVTEEWVHLLHLLSQLAQGDGLALVRVLEGFRDA